MNILFIGDIFGKKGREAIRNELLLLKKKYDIDFTIANAENTTHGRSLNNKHYKELQSYGIDFFTMGNHTWQLDEINEILKNNNIIRPMNVNGSFVQSKIGDGTKIINIKGIKIQITNLLGMSIPMNNLQTNAFVCMKQILRNKNKSDIHIVDFHCETTSEKNAFFLEFCGKVNAILGTHTHVQTNDAKIYNNTAYITDVGMTGASMGIIGANPKEILEVFNGSKDRFKLEPDNSKYQLNAVLISFDKNFRTKKIENIVIYEK